MTKTPMSDRDLSAIVMAEVRDAVGYIGATSDISNERATALRYYLGEPFGDERDGRSKVVSRDVADTVEWILPSLLRVFAAGDDVVRFEPVGQEDEAFAAQATDYINHVFNKDNNGFLILYTWFKDALIQKNGIVKFWWEVTTRAEIETYTGLTELELVQLVADDAIEVLAYSTVSDNTHAVKLKRQAKVGRVRIEPVPPEEFLIARRARSLDDASFVGHRVYKTRSELIAAGYPKRVVENLPTYHAVDDTEEALARWGDEDSGSVGALDPMMQTIEIVEAYLKVDEDGDGIAELMKVTVAGGEGGQLLDKELVDDIPFAALCPVPMPHKFFGLSVADLVMDLQRIKSVLWRQMLDNLYLTNNPQREVVMSKLEKGGLDDLLNSKVGGIIRAKQEGAVRELAVPHAASASFPMMEYVDRVRQYRTGVAPATTGLDAGALENQTATAVNQMTSAANQRVELIARIFAETGVKDLFRGLLRLVARHQDKPRMVRLRNQWVPMSPMQWNAEMDVSVEVGLGHGSRDQQMATMMQILNLQKEALGAGGLGLVTPKHIYNALGKLVQWAGLKSVDPYFSDPEQAGAGLQAATAEQQPDLQMIAAHQQSQAMTAIMQQQAAAELQIKREKAMADVDLETQKQAARLATDREIAIMKAQNETQLRQDRLAAEMRLKEMELNAEIALEKAKLSLTPDAPDADGFVSGVTG
ncbi:MAG: hypothetical protein RIB43_16745 [Rhodospirillaceae bacterium]